MDIYIYGKFLSTTKPQPLRSVRAMHKANQKIQVRRILLVDYDSELALITCMQLCCYHQHHSVCQQLGPLPWLHMSIFSCSAVFKFIICTYTLIHHPHNSGGFYYCSTWLNFKVIFYAQDWWISLISVGERGGELRKAGWKLGWRVTSQRML